jgi:hypothetical protein
VIGVTSPANTNNVADAGASISVIGGAHSHNMSVHASFGLNGTANVSGTTDGVGGHTHSFSANTNDANHMPSFLSKKRFEFLFRGLIIMGNQNTQKGISILTRELAILDKLESVSKPCDCGKLVAGTKEPDRELVGGLIQINNQEFDLLYQYISAVPWSIGESSRGALKTLEWLNNDTRSTTHGLN